MLLLRCPWSLDVERIAGVTVVRFSPQAAREDRNGLTAGNYLFELADEVVPRLVKRPSRPLGGRPSQRVVLRRPVS